MNTFSTEISYDPAEHQDWVERTSNLACPKCGGTMFETEDYCDDIIRITLDCEDCGFIIDNDNQGDYEI